MKKCISTMIIVLLSLFSAVCVPAADSDSTVFPDIRQYREEQFSDVPSSAWFSNGVRTTYNKGIINGMDSNTFEPSGNITWAQAIVIAANVHTTYHGTELPDADGNWYHRHMLYADGAGLLPSTCPPEKDAASAFISRQELASLYGNILPESALPVINNKSIPDIASVDKEFRSAVTNLYAAGIFTGKTADGGFDPKGLATRAEIAAVITRLICPDQRVGAPSDTPVVQAPIAEPEPQKTALTSEIMANQRGNFFNGGLAVTVDDVTYYTYNKRHNTEDPIFYIISRSNNGTLKDIYVTKNTLTGLSAADDGSLYFDEGNSLRRLDPTSGKAETIYKTKVSLETYLIHDGQIYVVERYIGGDFLESWRYRIGSVENGKLNVFFNNITYDEVKDMEDCLQVYNGKLYTVFCDSYYTSNDFDYYIPALWSFDLKSGHTEKVIDNIYMGNVALSGPYAWYTARNENNALELKRTDLRTPQKTETISVLPEEFKTLYTNIYANGDNLYFQSSGAQRVWQIEKNGSVKELVKVHSRNHEYSTVTEQCILVHPLKWIANLYSEQIQVFLPNGQQMTYTEFLGKTE